MLITLGRVDADEQGLVNQDQLIVLLSYLALEGPTRRDKLSRLFWPHAANAANNLSSALTRLRGARPDAIDANDDLISTTMSVDAVELIQEAAAGRHDAVARRYKGAFLVGYHLPRAGADLEQWIYSTRERLANVALQSSFALLRTDASNPTARQLAARALEAADISAMSAQECKQLLAVLENGNSQHEPRLAARLRELDGSAGDLMTPNDVCAALIQRAVPECRIAIVGSEGSGRRLLADALRRDGELELRFPGGVREVETNFQPSGTALYEQVLSTLRIPSAPGLDPARWGKLLSTRPALIVLHDVNPTLSVRTAIEELADCRLSLIAISSSRLAPRDFEILESDGSTAAPTTRLLSDGVWDELEPADTAALGQLALFSGWFTFEDSEALTAVTPSILVRLQQMELLQSNGGRLRLPAPSKAFIEERSGGVAPDEGAAFRSRLVGYLLKTTERLDSLPWSERRLRSNLQEDYEDLWEFLVDRADWDVLESIAFPYYKYLAAMGDIAGMTRKFAEALAAVTTSPSPPSSLSGLRPSLHCALAWGYLAQRRDLDAAAMYNRHSLDAGVTSPIVAIDFDRIRALLFKRSGDFRSATELLETTVDKIQSTMQTGLEQRRLTAQVYEELGQNLRLLNDIGGSSNALRRGLDIARELGDVELESGIYLELSKTTSISDPSLGVVLGTEGLLLSNTAPPGRIHVALLHQFAESKLDDGYLQDCYRQATRAYHLGLEVHAYDLAAESLLLCGLVELNAGADGAGDALCEGFAAAAMLCDSYVVERASQRFVRTIAGDHRKFETLHR